MSNIILTSITIIVLLLSVTAAVVSGLAYFQKSEPTQSETSTTTSQLLTATQPDPYVADNVVIVNANTTSKLSTPALIVNTTQNSAESTIYDLTIKNDKTMQYGGFFTTLNTDLTVGPINPNATVEPLISTFVSKTNTVYAPTIITDQLFTSIIRSNVLALGNSIITVGTPFQYENAVKITLEYDNLNGRIYYVVRVFEGNSLKRETVYGTTPNVLYISLNIDSGEAYTVNVSVIIGSTFNSTNYTALNGLTFNLVNFSINDTNKKRFTYDIEVVNNNSVIYNMRSIINGTPRTATYNKVSGKLQLANIDSGCEENQNWCRYMQTFFYFLVVNNSVTVAIFGQPY